MKIIHTGDIHLGSAFRGLTAEKAKLRQAEILDGFRRLCLYAKQNGVDGVLIAGDLFDENGVPSGLQREVFSAMAQALPVCFFYISGNHDGFSMQGELPKNLYLFSKNRSWQSYDLGDGVTVTGIDERYVDGNAYANLSLRSNRYNILMMHGELTVGQEGVCLSALKNKSVDYLALGHIHQPMMQSEKIDGRGRYRYCGCLEGRGFDECGKRGFFLLEIRDGKCVQEGFYSLAQREIRLVETDISDCKNYYEVERACAQALAKERREDIVKLILRGRHIAELKKDVSLLTARFGAEFFHFKAVDCSSVKIDPEIYKHDLSERGEFVRTVMQSDMSEEEKIEVLEVGLKALAGEDIDL